MLIACFLGKHANYRMVPNSYPPPYLKVVATTPRFFGHFWSHMNEKGGKCAELRNHPLSRNAHFTFLLAEKYQYAHFEPLHKKQSQNTIN